MMNSNARDFAMARLAAALHTVGELREGIDTVLGDFKAPDDGDTAQMRGESIEELQVNCHEILTSLQLAHEATLHLEPSEVAMSEDDLAGDDEEDEDEESDE